METTAKDEIPSEAGIAIGELSKLTGISTHTLRIWERRYGSPVSMRLPSGHRRYPKNEVPRLRAVALALQAGKRPSKVVSASLEELEKFLDLAHSVLGDNKNPGSINVSNQMLIEQWLEGVHKYCNQTLDNGFYAEWGRRGPLNFVQDCAGPFANKIGRGWECGELSISQEHFASERLNDFLGSMWRRINERNVGDIAVLATLPGENHSLGLQMCAVVTAITGRKIIYLGSNTPCEEIIASVSDCQASRLSISVSSSYKKQEAILCLEKIRRQLPSSIQIYVGGEGAPGNVSGVIQVSNFKDYFNLLQD
ncbi:MAG: HTH-type transcriptional repressor CarH [Nitrospinaceae bacterium]|nr:MAG: HTH-type transcriptional repressor CarH [Nitrospinaceae bacterium]